VRRSSDCESAATFYKTNASGGGDKPEKIENLRSIADEKKSKSK
jgi:hypothetical protein